MSYSLCKEEVQPLVEKLMKAFPENLGHIDPERIVYVKTKSKKRKSASISSIKSPYNLFVEHKYILTVYDPKFDSLEDNKKAVVVFDELLRIKDFEEGTLNGYSVISNYETLAKWGIDWQEAEEIPSVFGK